MNKSIPVAYKKLLVIGDSKVGKTCLINRMQYGTFVSDHIQTNGNNFYNKL